MTQRAHAVGERAGARETSEPPDTDDDLRVLVVGPSGTGGIRQYIDDQVERLALPVETHDTGSPDAGDGLRWFLAAVLAGLAAMARFPLRQRPSVVHVHTSYRYSFYRASFYVLYTRYVWRRPVVLHVHGSSFDTFVTDAGSLVATLQRVVFGASDRIIVLSPYWRSVLAERTDRSRIRVLPNAVDADSFDPDVTGSEPHLVFVSNLIERKGVREFLAAVETLLEGDRELRVTIAGDGPLASEVRALADRHDQVTYHGYVSEQRKRDLLAAGSVFVLPTRAEGLPIAILEAMAAGNAIVSTPVGSIPEVIDDDRGILVPPGDADALEVALSTLLDDPDRSRSMATRNRRAVETTYSWDVVIEDLVDIYRTVRG